MRSTSRAFTLIELLAVIAITGVLASLLVGGISKIRDSARRSECASNLRQIGAAFQLYAIDDKGLYPAPRLNNSSTPPAGINPSGQNWQVEISPYIIRDQTKIWIVQDTYGQANIAHCPPYDLFFNTSVKMSSQTGVSIGSNRRLWRERKSQREWGQLQRRRHHLGAGKYHSVSSRGPQ